MRIWEVATGRLVHSIANSNPDLQHPDPEVMKRKHILQQAMTKAGFFPLPNECWHFTDRRFRAYPDTVPLSAIKSAL